MDGLIIMILSLAVGLFAGVYVLTSMLKEHGVSVVEILSEDKENDN